MQIRLVQVATIAAGIIAIDFVMARVVAPKIFSLLGLGPQTAPDCHCGGGCGTCAKNITDRAQVIDITDVRSQGVTVSV